MTMTEERLAELWEKSEAAIGIDGTDNRYIETMNYIVTEDVPT